VTLGGTSFLFGGEGEGEEGEKPRPNMSESTHRHRNRGRIIKPKDTQQRSQHLDFNTLLTAHHWKYNQQRFESLFLSVNLWTGELTLLFSFHFPLAVLPYTYLPSKLASRYLLPTHFHWKTFLIKFLWPLCYSMHEVCCQFFFSFFPLVVCWPCLARQGQGYCVQIHYIEYSSLRDFGPLGNNRSIFTWGFLKDDILACVKTWD
jgi:hypothetical protein